MTPEEKRKALQQSVRGSFGVSEEQTEDKTEDGDSWITRILNGLKESAPLDEKITSGLKKIKK